MHPIRTLKALFVVSASLLAADDGCGGGSDNSGSGGGMSRSDARRIAQQRQNQVDKQGKREVKGQQARDRQRRDGW